MASLAAREARSTLVRVTSLAASELDRVWRALNFDDAARVRDALLELLPTIGETYGEIAAAVAADLYDALREEAGAPKRFAAAPAPLPSLVALQATTRWGLGPLFSADPRPGDALTLLQGGLQRHVANAHRETITRAVVRDPARPHWTRQTSAGACEFCQPRAGIRMTSADVFEAHDHCHCIAEPRWG